MGKDNIPLENQEKIKKTILTDMEANRKELTGIIPPEVLDAVDSGNLSQDAIRFLVTLKPIKMTNKDKLNPHGKQVMDKVIAAGESHNFIRKFRQHF
jgi:spore maturation protein CgeB